MKFKILIEAAIHALFFSVISALASLIWYSVYFYGPGGAKMLSPAIKNSLLFALPIYLTIIYSFYKVLVKKENLKFRTPFFYSCLIVVVLFIVTWVVSILNTMSLSIYSPCKGEEGFCGVVALLWPANIIFSNIFNIILSFIYIFVLSWVRHFKIRRENKISQHA